MLTTPTESGVPSPQSTVAVKAAAVSPMSVSERWPMTCELKETPAAALDDPDAELGELLRAWDRAREHARLKFMARVGLQLAPTPPPPHDGLDIPTSLRRAL